MGQIGTVGTGADAVGSRIAGYSWIGVGKPATATGVIQSFSFAYNSGYAGVTEGAIAVLTVDGLVTTPVDGTRRVLSFPALPDGGSTTWTAPGDFTEIPIEVGQCMTVWNPSVQMYYGMAGDGVLYNDTVDVTSEQATCGLIDGWRDHFLGLIFEGGPAVSVLVHHHYATRRAL